MPDHSATFRLNGLPETAIPLLVNEDGTLVPTNIDLSTEEEGGYYAYKRVLSFPNPVLNTLHIKQKSLITPEAYPETDTYKYIGYDLHKCICGLVNIADTTPYIKPSDPDRKHIFDLFTWIQFGLVFPLLRIEKNGEQSAIDTITDTEFQSLINFPSGMKFGFWVRKYHSSGVAYTDEGSEQYFEMTQQNFFDGNGWEVLHEDYYPEDPYMMAYRMCSNDYSDGNRLFEDSNGIIESYLWGGLCFFHSIQVFDGSVDNAGDHWYNLHFGLNDFISGMPHNDYILVSLVCHVKNIDTDADGLTSEDIVPMLNCYSDADGIVTNDWNSCGYITFKVMVYTTADAITIYNTNTVNNLDYYVDTTANPQPLNYGFIGDYISGTVTTDSSITVSIVSA
jgi:hypothetical protein